MSEVADNKLISKYLFEYAVILQAEGLRNANMGLPTDELLFNKSEKIKTLAESILVRGIKKT